MRNQLERFQKIFIEPIQNNPNSYKQYLRYDNEFWIKSLKIWLDSRQGKFWSMSGNRFTKEQYILYTPNNNISKIHSTKQLAIILDRIEI